MFLEVGTTDADSGLCGYLEESRQMLTAENLNELDALTFAILCNFKFEDVFSTYYEEETISVRIFAFIMLQKVRDKKSDRAMFLRTLKNCPRFDHCKLKDMRAENKNAQWGAFTVQINDGSGAVILAMRGTDATVLGWTEDLLLAYDPDGTKAQQLSAAYLENCDAPAVFLTGHSKGGNDVVSAFCMAPPAVRERVIRIYNFDGPGLNDECRERFREGYDELQDKLISFYPQNAIIGKLLNNPPGKEYYVESVVRANYRDRGLFGEHDPFSWTVRGDRFVETKQTALSKWLDESLDDTLSKLSNGERKHVVEVFLKYNVPALIIGQEEKALADDKSDAASVWQRLTPEEKRATERLVALFIRYGLHNGKEMAEVTNG